MNGIVGRLLAAFCCLWNRNTKPMTTPLLFPRFRAFDSDGHPLAGGFLFTYAAGTSTAQATYTTAALTTANDNPVDLDANGEASIWPLAVAYKLVLQDALGVVQWTEDNVTFAAASTDGAGGGVNLLDNGGLELTGAPGRPTAAATGAGASCFVDRWWGYRGGGTGYVIANLGGSGLPNRISISRDAANAATTALVVGQSSGLAASGLSLFNIVDRTLNPSLTGLPSAYLVFSVYLYRGANFSGASVDMEIVTASSDVNIVTGTWTQEAVTTISAASLSTSAWTRFAIVKSGAWANGAAAVLGVRLRYTPVGTAGAEDTLYATGAKLELVPTAAPTGYVIPVIGDALLRAKRFYHEYGGGAQELCDAGGGVASTIESRAHLFPVEMIKAPVVAKAGTWAVTNCAQPSVAQPTRRGWQMLTTATAAGAYSYAPNGTDDLITFDAETP